MGIPAHGDDIISKTLRKEEVTGCHRQTGMSPGEREERVGIVIEGHSGTS